MDPTQINKNPLSKIAPETNVPEDSPLEPQTKKTTKAGISAATDSFAVFTETEGIVKFGEGVQGKIPETTQSGLDSQYRSGGGLAGNDPERPDYFSGKLLSAADLTREQEYFRDKRKLHPDQSSGISASQLQSTAQSLSEAEGSRLNSLLHETSFAHLQGAIACAANRLSLGKTTLDRPGIEQDLDRQFPEASSQEKMKMTMLTTMILMGDVGGALQSYANLSARQFQGFSRQIVDELEKVRDTRDGILSAFAQNQPPDAYDSATGAAAADQNQNSKYTQFVQMNAQLVNETQNTERELLDMLSEGRRNIESLWESYSTFRESESRTTRNVIDNR